MSCTITLIDVSVTLEKKRDRSNVGHIYKFVIYVDFQTALKAIRIDRISSKLVVRCKQALCNLMNIHKAILCWVPVPSNVDGNEIANEFARLGSSVDICEAETSLR